MSTPSIAYRIYDKILKAHPNPTKPVASNAHMARTRNNEISLISGPAWRDIGDRDKLITITKSGAITFFRGNISRKQYAHRAEKFLAPLNRVLIADERFLSRISVSEGYSQSIHIHTVAVLPSREMTEDEQKAIDEYKAERSKNGYMSHYVPSYLTPQLHYGPSYWHGIVDYMDLAHTGTTIKLAPGKTTGGMYFPAKTGAEVYPLLKGWHRKKFYKVMNEEGVTGYAKYEWEMPHTDHNTGEVYPAQNFHEVKGELRLCSNGIHVCTIDQIQHWANNHSRNILVEMETGPVYNANDSQKYITRKARVKRVIGRLNDALDLSYSVPHMTQTDLIKKVAKGQTLPQKKTATITISFTTKLTQTVTFFNKKGLDAHKRELQRLATYPNFGNASKVSKVGPVKTVKPTNG